MTQEALKLAIAGVEIHSPNSPEYIVCAALIEALAQTQEPKPLPQGWNVVEVVGNITKVWRMTEEQITSFSLAEPLPQRTEQNFCSRCGKRTADIHTCTPPQENT